MSTIQLQTTTIEHGENNTQNDAPTDAPAPFRWRPDAQNRRAVAPLRGGRGRMGPTRMSETARRMLGLMSVMMAGRAQGMTTGVFSQQVQGVQTGLDGNILLKNGTNIAVRTVGRGRISKRGCVCPCKCGALPKYVSGGRVFVKDSTISKAPIYLRDFLIRQKALTSAIEESDVSKNWKIPQNLSSGIFAYLSVRPSEYTWKLKLKREKFNKRQNAANGQLEMPKTEAELYEMVSSDEDMEDTPWKAPELEQAELCIDFCSCKGAPKVSAPTFPIMRKAVAARGAVLVYFDPPLNNGGSLITGYQVTSTPENKTQTGKSSPIKIKGLTVGVWYSFVVRARNRRGLGPPSAPSSQIRMADVKYVSQLEDILSEAQYLESVASQNVDFEIDKARNIAVKSIRQVQDEDLAVLFEQVKGKYLLKDFSMLRQASDYAKTNFVLKRRMLSHTNSMIPRSLYRFNVDFVQSKAEYSQLKQLARDTFTDILIFTGLRTGHRLQSASAVISKGKNTPMLRDEIYCQLIKQTTDCKDEEALIYGFKLLYLCLSVFEFSQELSLILLSHIAQFAKPKGFSAFRNVSEAAALCYRQWKETSENGPSKGLLTPNEISSVLEAKAEHMRLEIYVADGSRVRMKVPPFTTMKELTRAVCAKFGLKGDIYLHFRIKIIANIDKFSREANAYRPDTEVAHWYGRWKDIVKRHPLLRYKLLLFKWRWVKTDRNITPQHPKGYSRILYYQSKSLVNSSKIPLSLSDACLLGALQLVINNEGKLIPRYALTDDMIRSVIPMIVWEEYRMSDLIDQVFDNMKSFSAVLSSGENKTLFERFTKREELTTNEEKKDDISELNRQRLDILVFDWQRMFLNYLSNRIPMYGTSYFDVKFETPEKYRGLRMLGINWHRIAICNDESEILETVELERLSDLETAPERQLIQFQIMGNTVDIYSFNTEWFDEVTSLMGTWIADCIEKANASQNKGIVF